MHRDPSAVARKLVHVAIMRLTVDWCMLNRCARSLYFKPTDKEDKKKKKLINWLEQLSLGEEKKGYPLNYELVRLWHVCLNVF